MDFLFCSVFQYEAYFRKCDRPKNLKKEEWRAVGTKLHQLQDMGYQTRVKVSGQVRTEKQVERSLRHAFHGVDRRISNASAGKG
jgi:hypothetical protein